MLDLLTSINAQAQAKGSKNRHQYFLMSSQVILVYPEGRVMVLEGYSWTSDPEELTAGQRLKTET